MKDELRERRIVITGANTGIGRANVHLLADRGVGHLVLAVRTPERVAPVVEELRARNPEGKVDVVQVDLGDLSSVRRAADELLEKGERIDVLVNNAGLAALRGQTKDGYELAFGTNHLGHWLWTEKLLPLVKDAPQGRIVIVASAGHYNTKALDWDALRQPTQTVSGFPEYCASKLCNVLHAKALAKRLEGTAVTTYSLHPGGVASDIWQRRLGRFAVLIKPFLMSNEDGARTQLVCETDPSLASQTGLYYDRSQPKKPSRLARDEQLRDELDTRSREMAAAFL
ncbi:MAG: SDR family oxidoreductase [Alphaproteobacteria bacterium]|nr:SDR family oxidoreductase [Alphaproteobacteria bacterium]MCB9699208.1 SDR family oxidoreductase [Alphaproteobacteria bacterium]